MKRRHTDDPRGEARVLPLRGGDRFALRDVVDEALRGVTAERDGAPGVCVVVDVPPTMALDADGRAIGRILAPLLGRAFDRARLGAGPCRPEVVVTGVECADGIEIEVAASGAALEAGEAVAFGRRGGVRSCDRTRPAAWTVDLLREAALVGGTFHASDCPEGGAAITLRLPRGRAALRRAA